MEPEYVIWNAHLKKYWCAGVCDKDTEEEATRFQNSERQYIRLYGAEQWVRATPKPKEE